MKKVVKAFILIISLFMGINVVKADRDCDDIVMYANSDFWSRTGINMNYSGINYNFSLYTLKDASGSAFSSYCRNAGISAGKSYDGQKFKCKQVVFDTTTSNETRKTYDAGIVEILKNGYSTRNPNTLKLEKNQEYTATNLALRTYEMLWPNINTNGSNSTGNNKAHQYYANKWLDDAEIQSLLKQSVGSVRAKYSNATTVTSWTIAETGVNVTTAIEEEAKRLVKLGLQAAANYKKNGAATLTWNDKPTKQKSPTITDASGVTKYETALTYVFTATKFKSKDAYINMNFECSDCTTYGVDYTIYVNNREVGKTISGNLLPSGGAGKIIVKIVFKSDSKHSNFDDINYNLNVKYYDESISTEAYDMYSASCYSNTSCQHFYMLYADDVAQEADIKGSLELATINCTDLEYQCVHEKDKDACARWAKLYNSTCADCQAYVSNAECSDTESEIDVKEGYDINSSTCQVSSKANVLQCIIGQTDKNGNSYKATNLANNKYCSVWCKEDYHFTLPGNKETNSGRYFTLEASISGTKTCYTSKINKETFETDYEEARKKVVDAYNQWAFYQAAVNNHGSNLITWKSTGASHAAHYYDCTPCPTPTEENPNPVCLPESKRCKWCEGDKARNYQSYKYTFYFTAYDYNGGYLKDASRINTGTTNTKCSVSGNQIKCTYQSYGYSWCNHSSCGSVDGTNITKVYNTENINSAAASLNSVIGIEKKEYYDNSQKPLAPPMSSVSLTSLNGILNNYNYCSRWSMDYEFDPDIHFWYEEDYMNNLITDQLSTVGSVNKSNITVQRCSSDTNESYESCSTGWTSNTQFKTERKFLCYKKDSGYECGWRDVSISQTIRMKESISADGSYITPTQFYTIYPSGSIAVAAPGTKIENATELTNKLPVGLGTTQGVYNYVLMVENLGEYYNSDELGRIWGAEDSVVSTTLKENSKCQANGALKYEVNIDGKNYFGDGVYNCAYKVNCPDCPIECEPDGCENPDCPDNDCPVDCDDCVYTNSNTDVNYRPITPDDLNPNDRELGKNWEFNDKNIKTGLELKAYATTKEIEDLGETIYDINFENPGVDEEFAMKVTMDSAMISKIRAYNDKYEDTYGYLNNSLKCYDYKNSADGKTYKNIFCYSELLDELLTDSDTKDNIKITVDRPTSEAERKNYNPTNGYFTTWTLANSSKWNIKTAYGFSINNTKKGYGTDVNIGPSWK